MNDSVRYLQVLELYHRPDTALFVPETGRSPIVSRYCFAAIARGAIGWSPFGMDQHKRDCDGASGHLDRRCRAPESIASNYRALGLMMREIAELSFEGRLQAAVEAKRTSISKYLHWAGGRVITFGPPTFGCGRNPQGNPEPVGRVLIAKLGENEFLVTGNLRRADFQLTDAASTAAKRDNRNAAYGPAIFN